MKFLKLFLLKINDWWKFLFFIGIFFLVGNNVYASLETFDSYSNNYQINNVTQWSNSDNLCKVSNSYFSSSPNSLKSKYYYDSSKCIYQNNNQIFSVSFSINDINNLYNGGYIQFFSATAELQAIIGVDLYYPNQEITLSTKNCTPIKLGDITNNSWHNVFIQFNNDNIKAKIDLNDWTIISTTTLPIYKILFNSNSSNSDSPGLFLDDLTISESPSQSIDLIDFINPLNNGFYNLVDSYTSPYYFNWHIKFNLSTTTVAEFPDDRPFVTISFEKPNSFNPTIFEMLDFVLLGNEDYGTATTTLIDEDKANYPSELGEYNVIATLWDIYSSNGNIVYDHILAQKEINFTIQGATTTTPTAWCGNLCADIATSTNLLGEIGNGVNCALRSATCYLFYPHKYNIDQFFTQYENFKQVFPFNTFFDIASTTQNAFASSTMNNNNTFGLPNIRKSGTTTQYYIQPLLSSSTMASFIGSSNATLFRTTISYLIYAITAGGIFLIIWL